MEVYEQTSLFFLMFSLINNLYQDNAIEKEYSFRRRVCPNISVLFTCEHAVLRGVVIQGITLPTKISCKCLKKGILEFTFIIEETPDNGLQ